MKVGMTKVSEVMSNPNQSEFSYIISFYVKAFLSIPVLLGITSYALSLLSWLWVISKVDLSYARPFVAIGYILVALYGYHFLNENVNWERWVGIAFISVGVYFVALSG